jgi:hypothetical protein
MYYRVTKDIITRIRRLLGRAKRKTRTVGDGYGGAAAQKR